MKVSFYCLWYYLLGGNQDHSKHTINVTFENHEGHYSSIDTIFVSAEW